MRDRWGPSGRYGARKIGNGWYFDREQVEARQRARYGHAVPGVVCWGCGEPLTRTPSQLRRGKRPHCGKCWPEAAPQRLAEGLADLDPDERFKRQSEGQQLSWSDGNRDRDEYAQLALTSNGLAEILRLQNSTKTRPERIDKMIRTRTQGAYGLTEERWQQIAINALSSGQLGSARSQAARDLEQRVAELWPTDKTLQEIADSLHVSRQQVWRICKRLELPKVRLDHASRVSNQNP